MIRGCRAQMLVLLVVSAAVLAGSRATAAGQPPLGLTLADLHAIRDANLACSAWLPKDLSAEFRKLLLERSDQEVVLILLYPDGTCLYRGKTEPRLQPGSNNKEDYKLLLDAMDRNCFKVAATSVVGFELALQSKNPAGFARYADTVFKAINEWEITEGQATYFKRRIGQTILELPADDQKTVLEFDTGNRLRNALKLADHLEQSKIETIKKATAPAASPADYRILAGQFVHGPGHLDGMIVLPSTPTKGGAGIYRSQIGPGRSVLIRTSPEIAKSLNQGTSLADFTKMAEKRKLEIYFDRMGQEKPTKIDGSKLKTTIQQIQLK